MKPSLSHPPGRPPTIGYVTTGISADISRAILAGVAETAAANNVTLFTFVGGFLNDPTGYAAQANILYRLASEHRLDGLITWASSIGGLVERSEIVALHRHYAPLPIVSISLPLPDIPALMVDSYAGMRELVRHMIESHGYRGIAFIRGPDTHYYAEERYRAYLDTLADYGIDPDSRHVSQPLAWNRAAGAAAVRLFLDERGLRPGRDIQAIVGASDELVHGALGALEARGLDVPADIALGGVNDDRESRVLASPLTSVAIPFHRLGALAVETLLPLLRGERVAEPEIQSPRLIVRQSCGCPDADVQGAGGPVPARAAPHVAGVVPRDRIASRLSVSIPDYSSNAAVAIARSLVDALLADVHTATPDQFLRCLDGLLDDAETSTEISAWHPVLSTIRRELLPWLADAEYVLAENLLHQARVLVAKRARRLEARRRLAVERQAELLHDLGARLTTATDIHRLLDILAVGLPRLGIPSAYIALYDNPQPYRYPLAAPEYARLVLAYDDKRRIGLEPDGQRFLAQHLVPPGIFPAGRHSYIVQPLYYQEHQLGFALFEMGPAEGALYDALQVQISSALRGVHLLEQNVRLYQQALAAEQAAQEGRRLAEEADLLKSRFLSMVSHELLTPLVLLVGLSEMMLREGIGGRPALPEPHRQDVERIHVSAKQLGSLVRDVLDLTRGQVGHLKLVRKPLDLRDVLTAVASVGEQMARTKGLDWYAEIPAVLPPIVGDAARLHQVALNLVSNAVKFTARGEVSLRVHHDASTVTVLVTDTGLGVPVAEQAAIFDLFRQSERTAIRGYGGMGIGLAICRQLIELHGGELGLRSSGQENSGSTFYFTLPVASAEALEPPPPVSSHTVLILTEFERQGTDLARYLERQGYEVEILGVRENPDWLAAIQDSPPGALVLDSPSARLGWELIPLLRNNPVTQDIPLLFYSLYGESDSGSVLSLDYMPKPLATEALVHALQRYGLTDDTAAHQTVLVVDDDAAMRDLHGQLVQAALPDLKVVQAANGRVALDLMRRLHPRLVLLDLMMPELDGFGVLEAMHADEHLRHIPVIVLTAQILDATEMARLNQGVSLILNKGLLTGEETLARISEALSRTRRLGSDTQRAVRKVMAYIHAHYPEPLSREDLARHAGVSPRHLTRAFTDELGISPITYLNRYRIRAAMQRLDEEPDNITEIAIAVGFSSSAYFAEVFRRETGLSPSEYRHRQTQSA